MAKKYTPQLGDIITLKDGTIINIDTEEKLKVVTERIKSNYKGFKESTESIRNEPVKIPTQDTSGISMDSEVDNKPLSAKDKAKELMRIRENKIALEKQYANSKGQVEDVYAGSKDRGFEYSNTGVEKNKQLIVYNDNKKKIDEFNNQIKLNIEEQKRINEEINTAKDAAKKARAEKKLAKLAEEKNKLIEDAKKLTEEHLKKYGSVLDNNGSSTNLDIDKERIKKSLEGIDEFNKNINQDTSGISMDSEVKESPQIKLRDKPLQSTVDDVVDSVDRKAPKISMKDVKMSGSVDDVVDATKKGASSIDDILNAIPKEELAAANNAIKAGASNEVKESISGISKVLNKIPGGSKILAGAKVAGKLAGPVGVLVSLYEGLKDVRTDLIQDEEKTGLQNFVQNLGRTVPDIAAKTVINSVNGLTDLGSYIIGNTVGGAIDLLDMGQAYAFGDKKSLEEAGKRNFSKDITEALNKSGDQMAATAKAGFDKFNYGVDKDVDFDKSYEKYMKDQGRDSSGILLEVEDEKPVTKQEENKQQQNIVNRTSDTNQGTQQGRRLFKLKDGSFGYLSQGGENKGKLVRGFKTLDEAKNAVNQGVKGFHLGNIKNELSKVDTTDKSAVENVLTKYIKDKGITSDNAKDKGITDEGLKEIGISF